MHCLAASVRDVVVIAYKLLLEPVQISVHVAYGLAKRHNIDVKEKE
jgi:hypothetical protein